VQLLSSRISFLLCAVQFCCSEVWYGWWSLQRLFGPGCLLIPNFTQSECGKGLADGSGRSAKLAARRIMDRRLDDFGGAEAPPSIPSCIAELVAALQSSSRYTSTSAAREAQRVLKGVTYELVPESVFTASSRGVATVSGSSLFFSIRADLSTLTSDKPAIWSAARSCRCAACAAGLFDDGQFGPSRCQHSKRRPTAWTRHELRLVPAAAAAAAAEDEVEEQPAVLEAAAGSVVAIAAPGAAPGEQPFYLIRVTEVVTLQAGLSNHALLDTNNRAVKFRKGERVVRGYWLNRTGTADTADLPDDERFEFVELWDDKWRDTGTWEEGSEAQSWLSRSKNSVEVVIRADDVVVWDVEVEEAPALATRVHRQRGYPGWIGKLTAATLDTLDAAFAEDRCTDV